MQTALSRLDGVKSVTAGKRGQFEIKVLENKALLPDAVEKSIVEAGYGYEGLSIEAVGKVEKDGENYLFVARANGQKYTLKANDDVKKLVADGKTQLLIGGNVSQPEEKEGKKPLPEIEATSAKDAPAEKK